MPAPGLGTVAQYRAWCCQGDLMVEGMWEGRKREENPGLGLGMMVLLI